MPATVFREVTAIMAATFKKLLPEMNYCDGFNRDGSLHFEDWPLNEERDLKNMWNSFLGICAINPRLAWSVVQSSCIDDMGHRIDVLTMTKNGIPEGAARTEIVGVESLYPLSLHALAWESVMMHRMSSFLVSANIRIVGWMTDGIYFRSKADLAVTSCLLYTSPSPRDRQKSRMPSSA